MQTKVGPQFSAVDFLQTEGSGRKLVHLKAAGVFFSQGAESDCVLYLLAGSAKLTIVSKRGKEATITLLSVGDFIGEEALAKMLAYVWPPHPPSFHASP